MKPEAARAIAVRERLSGETLPRRIKIDGEVYQVDDVQTAYRSLPEITCGKVEFILAESSEAAGKAAREYWKDMAENDTKEFTCMVGEETLIQWALGHSAGPGSTHVNSLEEWLDLWLDTPEEHFASYDSEERTVNRCGKLRDELGFTPKVAYRRN